MISCSTCGKAFAKHALLNRHKQNKKPCKAPVQLLTNTLAKAGVPVESFGEFRDVSKELHTKLTKEQRQDEGIFFTPKKIRDKLFAKLQELGVQPKTILEPSFGSGEFLLDAKIRYPSAKLIGIEKNETLYESVKIPGAELYWGDFLESNDKADLILGNPPYFVMSAGTSKKEKEEFKTKYNHIMTGRPNIYVMFLYKCLMEHLEPNGYLAFILPTSLYNSTYYQPTRDAIQKYATICHLETLTNAGFYETGQETMLLILQKHKRNDDFIFRSFDNTVYLTPKYKELQDMVKGAVSLTSLGLAAKTGSLVWNQERDDGHLKDEGIPLIYSCNITGSNVTLGNIPKFVQKGPVTEETEKRRKEMEAKKQYVQGAKKKPESGPVLLVDRGYGNSLRFHCALCTLKEFYAENHLNVIYATSPQGIQNLERVQKSLQDPRTIQFVESLMGNGSVSASELNSVIPIF